MDNEKLVRADLRCKWISRPDAIVRLIELRYPPDEAQCIVEEWLQDWEFQKDCDEERADGWSIGNRDDGI